MVKEGIFLSQTLVLLLTVSQAPFSVFCCRCSLTLLLAARVFGTVVSICRQDPELSTACTKSHS